MIYAALWILAACIVVPVAILAGGTTLYALLAGGRWVYTLGFIIVVVVWISNYTSKQNREYETRKAQNVPLQQQCVDQVRYKANGLIQQAVNRGVYTNTYSAQLQSSVTLAQIDCRSKYPT